MASAPIRIRGPRRQPRRPAADRPAADAHRDALRARAPGCRRGCASASILTTSTRSRTNPPTVNELAAGEAYWRARFVHDEDEAARVLRDLTATFGRGRCELGRPHADADQPDSGAGRRCVPEFPPTDTIDTRSKATRGPCCCPSAGARSATRRGRREVFRVRGNHLDELVLSPDWLATDDLRPCSLATARGWSTSMPRSPTAWRSR